MSFRTIGFGVTTVNASSRPVLFEKAANEADARLGGIFERRAG